jgi:phytanoyl-CoA hydroxylase
MAPLNSHKPSSTGYKMLTTEQLNNFKVNGYLILPAFAEQTFCEEVIAIAKHDISKQIMPIEYEADTHYPGAPRSRQAEGGMTPRRLLDAAARHPLLAGWSTNDSLREILLQLLGPSVFLSQAHHNCIMTKQPEFSSTTGWHRDSRYWHFERAELISAWLALGNETPENGCLWVVPNSQRWEVEPHQLDSNQFLLMDSAKNRDQLARATPVALNQGDLLLFHSNLFHAAGQNTTDQTKFSLVFTYRAESNPPLPCTRSSQKPEVKLS